MAATGARSDGGERSEGVTGDAMKKRSLTELTQRKTENTLNEQTGAINTEEVHEAENYMATVSEEQMSQKEHNVAILMIQKAIDLLEMDSLTKAKKLEMKAHLAQAIEVIKTENSVIGALQTHLKATSEALTKVVRNSVASLATVSLPQTSSNKSYAAVTASGTTLTRPGPPPTERLHISFSEGSYPQDMTHAELKQKINSAVQESGNPHLKIQAVQKYKQSMGIIVESSEVRDELLKTSNNWGPKAFPSFSSVSPPRERHQILIHDIPTELTMEDIETGLIEDNQSLVMVEKPRWLLNDRTNKKRSSLLVAVQDAEMAETIPRRVKLQE
ncbi:hypothetical protein R1sor_022658 [Riccia sorocarpa]|uniref:Uncharacterized protein n=1 Tax=Riccia sorocarpa TaxID=122646 RepID=A0ABD3GNG7_9MARC